MLNLIENPPVRRSKGERTKNLILASTIAVLSERGIKGTTHRAVAKHADIQLSLTTYYFKDIHALVQQAFALNSENLISTLTNLFAPILKLVNQYSKLELRKVSLRVELREQLTELFMALIKTDVSKNRKQLIVEQQLLSELQVSPALHFAAKHYHDVQLAPYLELCQRFSKEKAEINAEQLLMVIKQIQFRQLLPETLSFDNHTTRNLIQHILAIVVNVRAD